MKLAFYKAFQSKATFVDKVIATCTFGKYSHVEIIFSSGESFSISPRDGGSRYKTFDYNLDNWDMFELQTTEQDEELIHSIIDNNFMNKKYDYMGAIFSAAPFCIQKQSKLFCSEVIVDTLRKLPQFKKLRKGCNYSPNAFFAKLNDIQVERIGRRKEDTCTNIES